MSFASEHPVTCARREDLKCPESFPGSKWHQMKAQREGWFFSQQEDAAYCPAHVPKWVAGWRARRNSDSHH